MMKGTHASLLLSLSVAQVALAGSPIIVTNGASNVKVDSKSTIIHSAAVPPAPTTVSIDTTSSCPRLVVSWSAVAGVTSFIVYLEAQPLPWTPGGGTQYTVPSSSTKKAIMETLGGKPYLAKVASCNANGCSAPSAVTASGISPNVCP